MQARAITIQEEISKNEYEEFKVINEIKEEKETNEIIKKQDVWQIEIPSINLVAPIAEGTTDEIMNEYVGHFEGTSKWSGNIGLAAHNRRISC